MPNVRDDGTWRCFCCNDVKTRVVRIDGTRDVYYCEQCLFDSVVDGSVTIGPQRPDAGCDNCGDSCRVLCEECASSEWSSDDHTCYGCGDSEARCYSCARHYWDLHDYNDCDHDDCNNTCGEISCYEDTQYTFCDECMRKHDSEVVSFECEGCSNKALWHYCEKHDPVYGSGAKPTPKSGETRASISDDGSAVIVDGITIQF